MWGRKKKQAFRSTNLRVRFTQVVRTYSPYYDHSMIILRSWSFHDHDLPKILPWRPCFIVSSYQDHHVSYYEHSMETMIQEYIDKMIHECAPISKNIRLGDNRFFWKVLNMFNHTMIKVTDILFIL